LKCIDDRPRALTEGLAAMTGQWLAGRRGLSLRLDEADPARRLTRFSLA
jgi:hypothetical protein